MLFIFLNLIEIRVLIQWIKSGGTMGG